MREQAAAVKLRSKAVKRLTVTGTLIAYGICGAAEEG